MSRIVAFLKKEFLEMLPPTVFFLAVFHVVMLARNLTGAEGSFYLTTSAAAMVGALVMGKSVLIVDALPLFHLFRERRLIYNVLWRTFLYLSIALVFQVLEELIPLVSQYGGLGPAFGNLVEEIHWPRFWGTHLLLAVFALFYTVTTALIGVIGGDRALLIFFGARRGRDDHAEAGR